MERADLHCVLCLMLSEIAARHQSFQDLQRFQVSSCSDTYDGKIKRRKVS